MKIKSVEIGKCRNVHLYTRNIRYIKMAIKPSVSTKPRICRLYSKQRDKASFQRKKERERERERELEKESEETGEREKNKAQQRKRKRE